MDQYPEDCYGKSTRYDGCWRESIYFDMYGVRLDILIVDKDRDIDECHNRVFVTKLRRTKEKLQNDKDALMYFNYDKDRSFFVIVMKRNKLRVCDIAHECFHFTCSIHQHINNQPQMHESQETYAYLLDNTLSKILKLLKYKKIRVKMV